MNVVELLVSSARRRPDHPAWTFGDRTASYRDLAARAQAVARGLSERGIRPGDRVVIDLPNSPTLIEVLFGCFWGGFVAVPVNWHLHPGEVAFIVRNCGARAVFISGAAPGELRSDIGSPLLIDADGDGADETGGLGYTELIGDDSPLPPRECAGTDPAWLFYTSGTTGRPKGAILGHRNLLAMTLNYLGDIDPIADDAVFLHAAPLTHGSGLYLLPALARSASNIILDTGKFGAAAYFAAVERHRVTHAAFLAPTMLHRLVADGNRDGRDIASLRSIVVGGAPLYAHDLAAARALFGPIITEIYGQGEAPMTITTMRAHDPDATSHPGSSGRAFTGVVVRVGDGNGQWAGPGVPGEVCVRGDVVMAGYWDNPDATAAALTDGWLHTGDVGYLDDEGYLFLTDRVKDVIITGGSNVYPREVEEVLLQHDSIAEASVIGIPDREWGESVCAVVVPAPEAAVSEQELVEFCRAHLASFKKPRRFVIAETLPKNSTGKVLKRELRKIVDDPDGTPVSSH
ncbi:putative fatty-acid--CoA ligase [Nocardia nova SH22a]|uniref:Putative fatty-acid--CoA ligase n=1 Tax=Nocardia nova SH22a TaxID=1415166 RepID=W5TMW5_9NOCA|nr:AMP-binding protein [Nocardia nova]AHH18581.1 putative fatty-acid--CoA ligase [Nocardia nova SH22a]